jgi:hypothetical protein
MPTETLQIRCRRVLYLVRVTKGRRESNSVAKKAAMEGAFKYQKTTTVIESDLKRNWIDQVCGFPEYPAGTVKRSGIPCQ